MHYRSWLFSSLTSITLLSFYFFAQTIGYQATGFALLSAAIMLGAIYNHFTANVSNPMVRTGLPRVQLGTGDK